VSKLESRLVVTLSCGYGKEAHSINHFFMWSLQDLFTYL
jgi:hypothetical protein